MFWFESSLQNFPLHESKLGCADACTTSKVGAVPKKDWEEKSHLRVFPGAPKKGTRFERQTLEPNQVLDALIKTIYSWSIVQGTLLETTGIAKLLSLCRVPKIKKLTNLDHKNKQAI